MSTADGVDKDKDAVHITLELRSALHTAHHHLRTRPHLTQPSALSSLFLSTNPPSLPSPPLRSGGLELLFNKQKRHSLTLSPAQLTTADSSDTNSRPVTLRALIRHMRQQLITERVELFAQQDTVRPGILVLVNDCDWELLDGLEYEVKEGDVVTFISTLHGG